MAQSAAAAQGDSGGELREVLRSLRGLKFEVEKSGCLDVGEPLLYRHYNSFCIFSSMGFNTGSSIVITSQTTGKSVPKYSCMSRLRIPFMSAQGTSGYCSL